MKICPNLGPKLNVKIGSDKIFKKSVGPAKSAPGRTARGVNKGGGCILVTCYKEYRALDLHALTPGHQGSADFV